MRRRILAALVACALAVAGALVLIAYVQGADARAQADQEPTSVLVVQARVPAGTEAALLGDSVRSVDIPARLVAADVVRDLAELGDQVSTADLLPGDQLQAGRFAGPASLLPAGTVAVPDGLQEVSVTLEPQRAAGGVLVAGDRVGVLVTDAAVDATTGLDRAVTRLALDQVLVTRVQGGAAPTGSDSDGAIESTGAAVDGLVVTVAVDAGQAAVLVGAAELGTVWLSLQPASGTAPPTAEPPTAEPPTTESPISAVPTVEPPTVEPPTIEPPTIEPPTIGADQ
jgi:pilus assembly protein CpaB